MLFCPENLQCDILIRQPSHKTSCTVARSIHCLGATTDISNFLYFSRCLGLENFSPKRREVSGKKPKAHTRLIGERIDISRGRSLRSWLSGRIRKQKLFALFSSGVVACSLALSGEQEIWRRRNTTGVLT